MMKNVDLLCYSEVKLVKNCLISNSIDMFVVIINLIFKSCKEMIKLKIF